MIALHNANKQIAKQVAQQAAKRRLHLTVFSTAEKTGHFAGKKRYTAYKGSGRPYGTRDARVVAFRDAPFQKRGMPSVVGEHRALAYLLSDLS